MIADTGGWTGFRLSWRQACTPSAGLGSLLFIGALVGLVADLPAGDILPVVVAATTVVATVLWRRFRCSASVGPAGLELRRLATSRFGAAELGAARLVGRASQLRVQVQADERWVVLPAPRCLELAGDAAFRTELALFASRWPGLPVQSLALPDDPPLVLRRKLLQVWPWLVLGLADLVWQLLEPTMGADLTLVAIALLVLLRVRQPRPVNSQGVWIGDGDRFVEWRDVEALTIDKRRGARRILLRGEHLHERLIAPVDAWWSPDRTFDCTFARLSEVRSAALTVSSTAGPSRSQPSPTM